MKRVQLSKMGNGLTGFAGVVLWLALGCSADTDGTGAGSGAGMSATQAGAGAIGGMSATGGTGAGVMAGMGAGAAGMVDTAGVDGAGAGGMDAAGMGGGAAGMMETGGAGGMDGTTGGVGGAMTGGAGGGMHTTPPHEDLGVGDGSDVVLIGDSWMNLGTVGIQQSVIEASGQPYRGRGVSGTRLLDGVIPAQYTAAKAENPNIKTVIISGGGNDILQNPAGLLDCPLVGDVCKGIIDSIGVRYVELEAELAADGVEDLIIVNYARGTLLGAGPIEYSIEALGPDCQTAPLRCHMIDPDEVRGMNMELRDGIHPTDANYDLLGEHIYGLMEAEGMRR